VKTPLRRLLAIAVITSLAAVVLTMSASARPTGSQAIQKGGILKLGWETGFDNMSNGFDPTGEYLGDAFGIHSNLLTRTLVGYRHTGGPSGNQLVPDIATKVPRPTNGGKTYTFTLKKNIKFGPPVNRAVVAQDFVTALNRVASPKDGAQYAFYYSVIQGWDAYGKGKAKKISGISTPNASTLVIKLTRPTGDFLMRMAMPAAAPMANEVTKCFAGQPGKYGRNIVSTAGYMFKGSDSLDISSCAALKPASGFDGKSLMHLVRNPSYVQSTDPYRKNYADEIMFIVNSSATDIYNKIEAGQLHLAAASSIPPQIGAKYSTRADLKQYLKIDPGDRTWYLTMNLTQPPFDDLKVRQAMNWVMDKAGLQQAWGGAYLGAIAHHMIPDSIFQNQLADYKPYATPGNRGSVAKAKAVLKGSKYDTNGDGTCSAPACKNVLMIADVRQVDPKMTAVIEQAAAKIGITFTVRATSSAYPTIQTPAKNTPFAERPGWGKDYADALTFFTPLFDGRTIIANGNVNYSLVGITPAQCKALKVTGNCTNVPNINKRLDACAVLSGQPRISCYANLDKYLTEKVVPWVPWLNGNVARVIHKSVTHYQFDQFSTTPAWSNIAIQS
jgi:peptide/nickel transport system substrate-binding protein